ncbi:MAG: aminotransferase class V-fold PLP-dependent enzyme, partial [Candidatus Tectomicrobia bacterium]|nr:aminotransferase class V-fold PLP-dependent enzyme [Candidatus Tectomicrobia bacterium]
MLPIAKLKADFPILQREIHGRPVIYLDNAATSQKPRSVIEAMTRYYEYYNANIHRGVYTLSEEATEAYEEARRRIAEFINATPRETIFTRGTTESLNLLAYTLGEWLKPGDEIVISQMEHHSNIVPWQSVARRKGVKLTFLEITKEGTLDQEEWERQMTPRTKIVSIVHMSNVLGTINPVKEIAACAHKYGALCIVDAAQSVPHLALDVRQLDCDFLAFSGHKMLGPTGIGILFGKEALLE